MGVPRGTDGWRNRLAVKRSDGGVDKRVVDGCSWVCVLIDWKLQTGNW